MKVGNFYVETVIDYGIERSDKQGTPEICKGYYCQVFDDPAYGNQIDDFCLAVGHEIPDDSEESLLNGIIWYLGMDKSISERRKNELLENTLEWVMENITDDEELFNTLHNVIGWSKEELHDFSIESLDEYFENYEKIMTEFQERVNRSLTEYKEQWMSLSKEELINRSEEIEAIRRIADELPQVVDDEQANFLLRFKNPLKIIGNLWINQYGREFGSVSKQMSNVVSRAINDTSTEFYHELEPEPDADIDTDFSQKM